MSGAFGLAGFYFGRKPTSATSEAKVSVAAESMPWQQRGSSNGDEARANYKYQYHPGMSICHYRVQDCANVANDWY